MAEENAAVSSTTAAYPSTSETTSSAAYEIERIAAWVRQNGFERIALQFPDELLADAPRAVVGLSRALPGRKVFALGDSTYGSSSVDEVGAEHYGADCIVHVGPSDQQQSGSMPCMFVYGRSPLAEAAAVQADTVVAELRQHFGFEEEHASLVLLSEVGLHHALDALISSLETALGSGELFVAVPQLESATSGHRDQSRCFDWRFGALPIAAWWSVLGTLTKAAVAVPEPLRLCGRKVFHAAADSKSKGRAKLGLPPSCGVLFIGAAGSGLERRLLLRHGHAHPVWRLDPADGELKRLSSNALLLQRYRFVELAKSAGTIGILLVTSGAQQAQAVADRLELLARRAGRRVYRFIVGRLTAEKLGNFPEVECFVSLASPEHFPYHVKDFNVPIASPYEFEVALGAREWTGDYITDLDELLRTPLPWGRLPDEEFLAVQTLGAGACVRHFDLGDDSALGPTGLGLPSIADAATPAPEADLSAPAMPALVTQGLHGVAGRYASEVT